MRERDPRDRGLYRFVPIPWTIGDDRLDEGGNDDEASDPFSFRFSREKRAERRVKFFDRREETKKS